jgi:hypothetical protein
MKTYVLHNSHRYEYDNIISAGSANEVKTKLLLLDYNTSDLYIQIFEKGELIYESNPFFKDDKVDWIVSIITSFDSGLNSN